MKKFKKATEVAVHHRNPKCPIYEHDGKYYIKCNRTISISYVRTLHHEGEWYNEVHCIKIGDNEYWYM